MPIFPNIQAIRDFVNSFVYINTVGEIEADKMNKTLQGICDYLANTAPFTIYVATFQIGGAMAPGAGQTTYEDLHLQGRTIISFSRDGSIQSTIGNTPYVFNPNYFDAALNQTVGLITVNINQAWQQNEVVTIVAV